LLINQKFVILQLTLKYIAVIKKILLTLITVFAFSNVNAQTDPPPNTNIVGNLDCSGANINEFEDDLLNTDGKISYRRLNTPSDVLTSWGTTNGASLGSDNPAGIRWSASNGRWEYYSVTFIAMINTSDSILPPESGWTAPSFCTSLDLYLEVLTTSDQELKNSKINVYPNPSVDFISISNLKDAVQCRITNIAGQTVLSKVVDANDNQMDVQELSKGFYFVEIAGKKTLKFIKK
jgi:hypothetical protein